MGELEGQRLELWEDQGDWGGLEGTMRADGSLRGLGRILGWGDPGVLPSLGARSERFSNSEG